MDHTDSRVHPRESALETVIDNFLESGNKSGNYRDALERVLTQWCDRLADRGVETVERVNKHHMENYAKYLSRQAEADKNPDVSGGISAATAWTYYDYVSAFLSYYVR